jgi:hypothetical protein
VSRTNKADHPRERLVMQTVALPPQPQGIEPLVVMMRTDGKYIVYDPRRRIGDRTVALRGTLNDVTNAALETLNHEEA